MCTINPLVLVSRLSRLVSCWGRPGVRASSPPPNVTYCAYRGFALISTRRTMSPPPPSSSTPPSPHLQLLSHGVHFSPLRRGCLQPEGGEVTLPKGRQLRLHLRRGTTGAEQSTGDTVDTQRTIYFRAVQRALHPSLAAPSFDTRRHRYAHTRYSVDLQKHRYAPKNAPQFVIFGLLEQLV